MKKLLLLAGILFSACFVNAQNEDYKLGFGVHTGTHTYFGELGNESFTFDKVHPSFGLSLSARPGKTIGLSLDFGHGVVDHRKGDRHFRGSMNHFNGLIRFHLDNGSILSEDAKFAPFLFTGAGLNRIFKSPTDARWLSKDPKTVFNFPLGVGVNYDMSDRFTLQWKSSWNFMGTDLMDNAERPGQKKLNNDQFVYHNIGVVYNFYQPNPDIDGDGVLNRDDECKEVAGPMENKGCPWPDTDGDGVPDIDDKCPETPGTLKGCPDTDEDGIQDSKDDCPKEKGPKATKGCPDTDKDGVKDSEDKCPEVYGLKKFDGCPDSDGDGIVDSEDKCPNEAGDKDRQGCPAPKEKVLDVIYFEFDSYALTNESIKKLKAVATTIKGGTYSKIQISGNTDNVGPENMNKRISELRAKNVKNFLILHGATEDMFEVVYYGDKKPVESNATPEGRAKNRRTEIKGKMK